MGTTAFFLQTSSSVAMRERALAPLKMRIFSKIFPLKLKLEQFKFSKPILSIQFISRTNFKPGRKYLLRRNIVAYLAGAVETVKLFFNTNSHGVYLSVH